MNKIIKYVWNVLKGLGVFLILPIVLVEGVAGLPVIYPFYIQAFLQNHDVWEPMVFFAPGFLFWMGFAVHSLHEIGSRK